MTRRTIAASAIYNRYGVLIAAGAVRSGLVEQMLQNPLAAAMSLPIRESPKLIAPLVPERFLGGAKMANERGEAQRRLRRMHAAPQGRITFRIASSLRGIRQCAVRAVPYPSEAPMYPAGADEDGYGHLSQPD